MTKTRLDLIDPNLCTQLEIASKPTLRRVALAACNFALTRTDLIHPLLDQALQELSSNSSPSSNLNTALEQLVESLDEEYFDLKDAAENGKTEGASWQVAFCKARAANSVYFAIGEDEYLAATEAIYEANAATEDMDTLRRVVIEALEV